MLSSSLLVRHPYNLTFNFQFPYIASERFDLLLQLRTYMIRFWVYLAFHGSWNLLTESLFLPLVQQRPAHSALWATALVLSSLVHGSMTAAPLACRDLGTLPTTLPTIRIPISARSYSIQMANIPRLG